MGLLLRDTLADEMGKSERAPPGDLTHLISFYASSPLSISTSRSFVVSAARDRMSAISASSSFLRTCCTRSSCFLKGEKGRRGRNVNPSSIISAWEHATWINNDSGLFF